MILNVLSVVNGSLQISKITEWNDNPQGAEKKFTDTWGTLVSDPAVIEAEIKVLDEQLNVYNGLERHISHAVVEGYLHEGEFYYMPDFQEESKVTGRNDTLYIDLTEGQNKKKYKYVNGKYVAV